MADCGTIIYHTIIMALLFTSRQPAFLWLARTYHLSASRLNGNKVSFSYNILEVGPECDDSEVREAYLSLAKRFHPDSDSKHADTVKFAQIEDAYRTVMVCSKRIRFLG